MDGNFSLVRKKSSGSSRGLGNHGTRLFLDGDSVSLQEGNAENVVSMIMSFI